MVEILSRGFDFKKTNERAFRAGFFDLFRCECLKIQLSRVNDWGFVRASHAFFCFITAFVWCVMSVRWLFGGVLNRAKSLEFLKELRGDFVLWDIDFHVITEERACFICRDKFVNGFHFFLFECIYVDLLDSGKIGLYECQVRSIYKIWLGNL